MFTRKDYCGLKNIFELLKGAPGYGNKAVPSLDFGALTLSDNLIQGTLLKASLTASRALGFVRTYKCNRSRRR